ncbi:SPOR domain-containing protein [Dechloromonas sp. ARDL1]|uniref:SPOR domain-containing protein n=1 Tax=Dechloromonas sp. ARDL1 TaxID=3322121 RepID=UPI003DA7417C
MKVLVFLLVLGNLLFYAFTAGYLGHADNPDAGRVEQQIVPDRLRIVSRGEAPAVQPLAKPDSAPAPEGESAKPEATPEVDNKAETPKEEAPEKPDTPVCLAWRQLTPAEGDKVAAMMGKRFAEFKLSRKATAAEGNGWWVYIPSLPGKAEADKKAGELRDLGVSDFFIVQDGPSRHAISLGIFSAEKGAADRLAELKAKGVRSAVFGPRPSKETVVTLQVRGPVGQKAAVIAAVADAVQKTDALACK